VERQEPLLRLLRLKLLHSRRSPCLLVSCLRSKGFVYSFVNEWRGES
jgi:hypothetical protein